MHEVVFNVKMFCLISCVCIIHVSVGLCFNWLSHPPLSLSPGLPPPTLPLQGSLRSSHQISPQEFLGELKSGVMDERLLACLDSLRVSLTSNPVRYARRTLKRSPC